VWTVVVAGTLGIAVAGTAGASDDSTTAPRARGDRAAMVCEHLDAIDAQMAERLAHIASRQGWLADKRATAVAAGRDEMVARIDAASAKLTERAATVQERIGRLDTWAAEHCGQ
jgi:hypothetical protein